MEDWKKAVVAELTDRPDCEYARPDIYIKLAESEACDRIWASIEKRLGAAEKLHAGALRILPNPWPEDRIESFTKTTLVDEFFRLGEVVEEALRKPSFREAATVSQRREAASRIRSAVDRLVNELEILLGNSDYIAYPPELEDRLNAEQDVMIQEQLASLALQDPEGQYFVFDKNAVTIASFVAGNCCDPIRMLMTLQDGVHLWSEAKPMMARPRNPNANRLRLIRELTRHFRRRYNTPLRECTLVVTGIFFDCDGLNESDIAKLAP